MPLYEYECEACGRRFELIRKFSDPPLEACPSCGAGPVHKLMSSPAFQFKGSGWYITDYARKGKEGGKEGDAAGEGARGDAAAKPESPEGKSPPAGKTVDKSAGKPSEKPADRTADKRPAKSTADA